VFAKSSPKAHYGNMTSKLDTVHPINNISADTLMLTFEASRSPLIITDYSLPDNPIIYSNQAFLDLTGYAMKDVIGKNCRFLQGNDSDKKSIAKLRDAVKNQKSVRVTLKNYRKDGKPFWNDLIMSPIQDKGGKTTHFVGMQLDITDRIDAERYLRQKSEELEKSNRELEQFTYAASHDLQEPLRMINSYIQLFTKRYGDTLDKDAKTFLEYATEGSERMQNLVNDLLALSRVSDSQDRYRTISISDVVTRAIDNLQVMVRESGATVTVDKLPVMCVDPAQMVQLFQNLIGNAIKYCDGTTKPRITIAATETAEGFEFSVKDNGIGISKKHHERIFVIFQRLHTRSEYPGTGIGLAICSKIIDRHNGRIWVESKEGKGSTFKFIIPNKRGES
jgi:two-component system, chemotaxis family, sensor kinase Cph1